MNITVFESNFNDHEKFLRAFAYKLTKDNFKADDLFQQTALSAFRNKTKFKQGTNIKAWLCTIMKNLFINNYRKLKRANQIFDHSPENFYINSGANTIVNEGIHQVEYEELNALVNNLDDQLKKPFLMHFEGFKYEEISKEMELPLGTTKSRIFMARKALKTAINNLYN